MADSRDRVKPSGGSGVNRPGVLCLPETTARHRLAGAALLVFLSAIILVLLAWGQAQGQDSPEPADVPSAPEPAGEPPRLQDTSRDSLVVMIHRYSQLISAMHDSLSLAELGLGIELDPQDKAKLERSIQGFTRLIEEIGTELGDMDLEIANNQISLLDDQGEGIVINLPENIDDQLSQGLHLVTQMILSELPDSVGFFPGDEDGWRDVTILSSRREHERKIIQGNIVKVWDRLQVTEREDVRGDVVVVFGDAEISGRIDGDVVVVFGDLQLTGSAEVTGEVVTIGGRLDQDPDAEVSDVVVVDPWRRLGSGPEAFFSSGPLSFLLGQGEFLVMLALCILAFSLAPRGRLERSTRLLTGRPLPSLLAGLFGSLGLHFLALLVIAVLVLTVIGIPVALLVGVALVLLGVLSVGLVALVLGRRVCRQFSAGCGSLWGAMTVGLLALHLVSFMGQLLGIWAVFSSLGTLLVILGASIKLAAYFFGLGALVLSRLGSGRDVVPPDSSL